MVTFRKDSLVPLTSVLTEFLIAFSVSNFSLKSKLVANVYDGTSLISGHLNGLQHKYLRHTHVYMF